MAVIYHITSEKDWQRALEKGFYDCPSLSAEGFIHCSEENQVEGVLSRYFKGQDDLVKLIIDTDRLVHPLKYELAPSINQEFPHIYGTLNLDAVLQVVKV